MTPIKQEAFCKMMKGWAKTDEDITCDSFGDSEYNYITSAEMSKEHRHMGIGLKMIEELKKIKQLKNSITIVDFEVGKKIAYKERFKQSFYNCNVWYST